MFLFRRGYIEDLRGLYSQQFVRVYAAEAVLGREPEADGVQSGDL